MSFVPTFENKFNPDLFGRSRDTYYAFILQASRQARTSSRPQLSGGAACTEW